MNWYRLAQLKPPQGYDYTDFGHHDMPYDPNGKYSSGVKMECIWIMDREWKIHKKCKDATVLPDDYDPFDESEFQHAIKFNFDQLENSLCSGRYVEFFDKEPVVSMAVDYGLKNSPTGARKIARMADMLGKHFNTVNVYEF